jgi:hypothetical protein
MIKFPPSVEIKRVLAAAQRAGIQIGSVEIEPRKITIHRDDETDPRSAAEIAYDQWKSDERNASRVRHSVGKTDALPKKPRG